MEKEVKYFEIYNMIHLVLNKMPVGWPGTLYLNGDFLFSLNICNKRRVVSWVHAFTTTLVSLFLVDLKACLSQGCQWLVLMVTVRSWCSGILFHNSNNCRAWQTSMRTRFASVTVRMQAVSLRWISGTLWLCIQITLETLRISYLIISQKMSSACPSGCCEEISLQMSGLGNRVFFHEEI